MGGVHNLKYFPKFAVGHIVYHKIFHYRGVVFKIDFTYKGTPRSGNGFNSLDLVRPWYYILVEDDDDSTYVSEGNLVRRPMELPVASPFINSFFKKFENGKYLRWDECISAEDGIHL